MVSSECRLHAACPWILYAVVLIERPMAGTATALLTMRKLKPRKAQRLAQACTPRRVLCWRWKAGIWLRYYIKASVALFFFTETFLLAV